MKTTLSTHDIARALFDDQCANWSINGAHALAEYLDDNYGENEEFNRVDIRCDFSEHKSLQDWCMKYYGKSLAESLAAAGVDTDDDDEIDDLIRSHIADQSYLIEFDGGIIVSSF